MIIPDIDPTIDYFEVLGLPDDAAQEDIRIAHKRLSHKTHPDRPSGDEELFKQVQAAYDVIGNEERRVQYRALRAEYKLMQGPVVQSIASMMFGSIGTGRLSKIVTDSLFLFQEQMKMRIPPEIMNDLQSATRYVYKTWAQVRAEAAEPRKKTAFGVFEVNQ